MTKTNKPGPNAGMTEAQIIARFWGDLKQWPIEPDGHNFTQAQIKATAAHIAKTGDCLWHAQTVVMNWPVCHCAKCMGPLARSNRAAMGVQS